jgi:hypothetical protein
MGLLLAQVSLELLMVGLCDLSAAGDEGVNLGSAILRGTQRKAQIDALSVLHDRWFPELVHDLSFTFSRGASPHGL